MNIFAGNFSVKEDLEIPEIDYDIVKISKNNFFIMGGNDKLETSQQVVEFLAQKFGELTSYDISIDSEEEVEILSSEYEDGVYECVSFEGPEVTLDSVIERFADSGEVTSVREAGDSKKYGNKIVKADFLF